MPALLALALAATSSREALGQFGRWGAFREKGACFALAEPVARRDDPLRPYAAIATWPGRARAQLHLRLSAEVRGGTVPTLTIGGAPFTLVAQGRDAWSRDVREDRRIVAAVRRSRLMRVAGRDSRNRSFADDYPLRGAPSAIDAAAVACLP